MDIDFSDLRILWPPGLFNAVARRVGLSSGIDRPSLTWLMAEAFVDSRGLDPTQDGRLPGLPSPSGVVSGTWIDAVATSADQIMVHQYFDALITGAQRGLVRPFVPPRYYRQRSAPPADAEVLSGHALGSAFCGVLVDLDNHGYFDDAFGPSCCDARFDRHAAAREIFAMRLGPDTPWQWQPEFAGHDLEHVYDLVELCHDLVARPRLRTYHKQCDEWDYDKFDRLTGRMVYRWRINSVLERSGVDLRVATSGEEEGRLVHTPGDPRADLPERVLAAAGTSTDRERLRHAIMLFRSRQPSRNAKRDAIRALGDVLERRRPEVKKTLARKDEDALFDILNNFDIRHLNMATKGDYDEVFLDWVFWTLLASLAFVDARSPRDSASSP